MKEKKLIIFKVYEVVAMNCDMKTIKVMHEI